MQQQVQIHHRAYHCGCSFVWTHFRKHCKFFIKTSTFSPLWKDKMRFSYVLYPSCCTSCVSFPFTNPSWYQMPHQTTWQNPDLKKCFGTIINFTLKLISATSKTISTNHFVLPTAVYANALWEWIIIVRTSTIVWDRKISRLSYFSQGMEGYSLWISWYFR